MATSTWIADGAHGNLASTAENWDTLPASGRDIIFDGTSVVNCTFDLAVSDFASFSMNTGYTGTVTQTASFGCTDWILNSGVWTGNINCTLSCSGDISRIAGTFTDYVTNLVMTGIGKTIALKYRYLASLTIGPSASITISQTIGIEGNSTGLQVGTDASLIIGATTVVSWSAGVQFVNNGVISGSGLLEFALMDADQTLIAGVINSPLWFWTRTTATANRTVSLGTNTTLGNAFVIYSAHATYTCTLSHGSNYTLAVAGDVRLGTNPFGIIIQGTGAWTFGSYTQNGASSVFTQGGYFYCTGLANISAGTWNVNTTARVASLSQSGGTITVASGYVLYYESTASFSGGTRSGTISRPTIPSEKGDDAVLFETPSASAKVDTITRTFGFETKGTSTTGDPDVIYGSLFTCQNSGIAISITAWLTYINGGKIKFGIYKASDASLVGYTEEWIATPGYDDWKTLVIVSGGILVANTDYYLVSWQNTLWGVGLTYETTGSTSAYDSHVYDGFPNPWTQTALGDSKFAIFCTYVQFETPSASAKGGDAVQFAG